MAKEAQQIIAVAVRRQPLDSKALAKLLLAQVRLAQAASGASAKRDGSEEAAS